jgi:phage terminase large subunit GpA-like protein
LLAIAGSYTANAQTPKVVISDKTGWHKIGEVTVKFEKDRDEVLVIGADKFAQIQFKVTEAPIDLQAMVVYYENGEKQPVAIRESVKAPGESRVIDLKGGERTIKKIVFEYKTLPNRKDDKAHVEIWGLKTNTDKKEK